MPRKKLDYSENRKKYFKDAEVLQDIEDIINNNPIDVYKRLKLKFEGQGDIDIVVARKKILGDAFDHNKNADKDNKLFTTSDEKKINNYRNTLTNIQVSGSMAETFTDDKGNVKQTYIGVKNVPELTGPGVPPPETERELPDTEDDALEALKKRNNIWKNYLRSPDVNKINKQSFIFRVMADNRKNNFIFISPTPEKVKLTPENIELIIQNIDKLSKNKNFYGENVELFTLSDIPQNVNAMKNALKGNIFVTSLFAKKQGNSNHIKNINLDRIKAELRDIYSQEAQEGELERELGGEEPEGDKPGRKPNYTRLTPYPDKVRLPGNKQLDEILINELGVYESKLKYNMFAHEAYEEIKDTLQYQQAPPNAKDQMLINQITSLANKNKKLYNKEVENLYNYLGTQLGLGKTTKAKLIKKLTEQLGGITPDEIAQNRNEVNQQGVRFEELKMKDTITKEEEKELDDLMKYYKKEVENQEINEEILELMKKGLSVASQYTNRKITSNMAPQPRITKKQRIEVEQAQKTEALPEKVIERPVAIPDVNKELLNVKQKVAQIEKAKAEGKDYNQEELETLKREQQEQENILRGKRKDKIVPVSQPSEAIGVYRPYFKNDTEQNVEESGLIDSYEEHMISLRNAEIFDIPTDQTGGIGTVKTNILIKQNQDTFNRVNDGTMADMVTWDNYAQSENFWNPEPIINQSKAKEYINNYDFVNNEVLVKEFLEIFNNNNNGFMDQYQPAKETNNMRNIYMPPADYVEPTPYSKFADVVNQGYLETDFLSNVNYFINP